MTFEQVKAILDYALQGWRLLNDGDPDLEGHNGGGGPMSWATREELLAAVGKHHRLIDPTVIGNGMGEQAKLVIDLRTGIGGGLRMPRNGPYLDDRLIDKIVQWINEGCPQ